MSFFNKSLTTFLDKDVGVFFEESNDGTRKSDHQMFIKMSYFNLLKGYKSILSK